MGGLRSKDMRIVLLGKTGDGKSSSGNTIFGENVFTCKASPNSATHQCTAKVKTVHGKNITVVDTPGFFDTGRTNDKLKPAIVRCMTECAPGPHAFVIVLRVGRFTEQEGEVVEKIIESFGEDALKYSTVLFTHGNDLNEGQTIHEFVGQSAILKELVEKCGGGCHVIDNKYWNNNQQEDYRSNRVQVEMLLNTIEEMVRENGGGCYTNEMLQAVEREIQEEEEKIRKETKGKLSEEEIKRKAKDRVSNKLLIKLAGVATGALVGAFLGIAVVVGAVISMGWGLGTGLGKRCVTAGAGAVKAVAAARGATATAGVAGETIGVGAGLGVAVGVVCGVSAFAGAVGGGIVGAEAAVGAETPGEAAKMAAKANYENAMAILNQVKEYASEIMNSDRYTKLEKPTKQ